MTGTLTSLVFSIMGFLLMIIALQNPVFDTRMLIIIIVATSAIICSWLARIEKSIDEIRRKM